MDKVSELHRKFDQAQRAVGRARKKADRAYITFCNRRTGRGAARLEAANRQLDRAKRDWGKARRALQRAQGFNL